MTTRSALKLMTHRPTASVVREEDLRFHLEHAEARQLLLAAVHVTRDVGLIDRYAHRLPEVSDPLDRTRLVAGADTSADPPEVRAELVDILCAGLTSATQQTYLHPDDPTVFARMASVALGGPFEATAAAMCLEQSGFVADTTSAIPSPGAESFDLGIIGAGMTGLDAAVKASVRGMEYTVYDKQSGLGGLWWSQRYPGVAVDTPSLFYSLSYESRPDWSKQFPLGEEYRAYLNDFADKYGIRGHVACDSDVLRMEWLEDHAKWRVTVRDTRSGEERAVEHNAIVAGAGQFCRPKYPPIKGRQTFEGEQVHTGEWRDVDLVGKRVAVIGVGAAGVQIVGALAPQVAHMTVFQRQAHWVGANVLPNDGDVPASERWLRQHLPYYIHWTRFLTFYMTSERLYRTVKIDPEWASANPGSVSELNERMRQSFLAYVNATFGEGSELARKLTPDYPVFANRPVRDPGGIAPGGFYWAFLQPHVDLVTDDIVEVTPSGLVTADGQRHEVDVIVWATGMTIDLLSTIEIIGRDGLRLSDVWGDYDARSYLGGTVPGFPNLFVNDGPNTGISVGGVSHNFMVETINHYIFECLQLVLDRGDAAIEVTRAAHDQHNARLDERLLEYLWEHDQTAHSYFKNAAGRNVFQNPFPANEYWTMSRRPDETAFVLHPSRHDHIDLAASLITGAGQ